MKHYLLLVLIVFAGCTNHNQKLESADCPEIRDHFEKLTHVGFVSCMTACFGNLMGNSKRIDRKEELKNRCLPGCRASLDYPDLNYFKSILDENYRCNLDLSKKMAN